MQDTLIFFVRDTDSTMYLNNLGPYICNLMLLNITSGDDNNSCHHVTQASLLALTGKPDNVSEQSNLWSWYKQGDQLCLPIVNPPHY